jgi:hypothetical protein
MRLNEFAQLKTSDLIEHNGRPHLSVLCVQDPDEDDDLSPGTVPAQVPDDRRVKSASARRFIPLHPLLIEIGFLDFIRGRVRKGAAASVFRECKPDKYGHYSGSLGKRLDGKNYESGHQEKQKECLFTAAQFF